MNGGEHQNMRKRFSHICLLFCGVFFFSFGIIFNLLPGIVRKGEVMTPLFIGIGLIILTSLVKKRAT